MSRDELILEHYDYTQRLCRKLASQFRIHYADDIEDFIQVGMVGLIQAADRFDPNKSSVKFKTYLYKRVMGSLIDECRRMDFVKRRGREKGLNPAILSLEHENTESGLTMELEARHTDLDLKIDFYNVFRTLTKREKTVLVNFLVGNSGRGISARLEITEQRVSQILGEVKDKFDKGLDHVKIL